MEDESLLNSINVHRVPPSDRFAQLNYCRYSYNDNYSVRSWGSEANLVEKSIASDPGCLCVIFT